MSTTITIPTDLVSVSFDPDSPFSHHSWKVIIQRRAQDGHHHDFLGYSSKSYQKALISARRKAKRKLPETQSPPRSEATRIELPDELTRFWYNERCRGNPHADTDPWYIHLEIAGKVYHGEGLEFEEALREAQLNYTQGWEGPRLPRRLRQGNSV